MKNQEVSFTDLKIGDIVNIMTDGTILQKMTYKGREFNTDGSPTKILVFLTNNGALFRTTKRNVYLIKQ